MLRYRLDDLGWFQFEALIQSLLRADLGIGIESWGGSGDQGRDAYFDGTLPYPTPTLHDGPFLFQAKFVQGANAAGAKPNSHLVDAVRAECRRIKSRIEHGTWSSLGHYVLLTNVRPSAPTRKRIQSALTALDGDMAVHVHGGSDVCDMLDRHPSLRTSFPQLLSLRDLDSLVSQVVDRGIVERSRIACDCACELAPVFVPTSAYRQAWTILQKHWFAVLEGPPEMGKTAIAWMIGLVQLLNGWEVIVCDSPQQVFQSLRNGRSQVFIADDAFGRTEYELSRGRRWERDLDRLLRAVDARHWLLWTSRKHILERALRDLDLQGRSASFPAPGEVLVDASQLRINEKALILYRHARTATLDDGEIEVVKQHASYIVTHRSFTPERIRRFVIETLPGCAASLKEKGAVGIREEINEAISNPTDRMRRTFRALPVSHKWLLVGMLECGHRPEEAAVRSAFEAHSPFDIRMDFAETVEELRESFVNPRSVNNKRCLDWVHPSYRDLVIEELSSDRALRMGFLRTCSVDGLKLAVSESGGVAGERCLPLMVEAEAWTALQQRAVELVRDASTEESCEILTCFAAVVESARDDQSKQRLLSVLAIACETARVKWDAECTPLTGSQVLAYGHATTQLSDLPKMPDLSASWNHADRQLDDELRRETDDLLDTNRLEAWIQLVKAVERTEPRLLANQKFPEEYQAKICALLARIDNECAVEDNDDLDDARAEAERLSTLAEVVRELSEISGDHAEKAKSLHPSLRLTACEAHSAADDLEGPEPEFDYEGWRSGGFDVAALFSDL